MVFFHNSSFIFHTFFIMGFWRETASIRIQYGNNMETTWKPVNKLLDRVFFSAFFLKKYLTFSKQKNKVLNKWRQGGRHGGPLTGRAPAQEQARTLRGFETGYHLPVTSPTCNALQGRSIRPARLNNQLKKS